MKKTIFKHVLSVTAVAGFIFIAFGSGEDKKNENDANLESRFCNNDFYSQEATVFGETGKKVIMFRKNEYFNFKNTVTIHDETKINNTSIPSNSTEGTWAWADSLNFKILVKFEPGNNKKSEGIWEFSKDFKSLTIPPNEITLFRYESE
jgi:hypothetical protein